MDTLLSTPVPARPVPPSHQRSRTVRAAVLAEVFTSPSTTITRISDAVGVSRPTVTRAVAELCEAEYITEDGISTPDLGRPARRLTRGPGAQLVLGIDISPTGTRLRLITLTGHLVGKVDIPEEELTAALGHAADLEEWTAAVSDALSGLLDESTWQRERVAVAVVSVSGIVDREGAVLLSVFIPRISGVDLRVLFTETLGVSEVIVENDMNLKASAELPALADRGIDDFVYLTNHTALRPATVIAGRVHPGAHGAVGEANMLHKVGLIPETLSHDGEEIPFFEIAPRLDRSELDAWWTATFENRFARIIAVLVYPIDPQVVVISGGPITTSPSSLERIRRYLQDWLPAPFVPELIAASPEQYAILSGTLRRGLREAISRDLGVTNPPIPDLTPETLT